jgi:hypothetical protein
MSTRENVAPRGDATRFFHGNWQPRKRPEKRPGFCPPTPGAPPYPAPPVRSPRSLRSAKSLEPAESGRNPLAKPGRRPKISSARVVPGWIRPAGDGADDRSPKGAPTGRTKQAAGSTRQRAAPACLGARRRRQVGGGALAGEFFPFLRQTPRAVQGRETQQARQDAVRKTEDRRAPTRSLASRSLAARRWPQGAGCVGLPRQFAAPRPHGGGEGARMAGK